jgi:hypothetical protein
MDRIPKEGETLGEVCSIGLTVLWSVLGATL